MTTPRTCGELMAGAIATTHGNPRLGQRCYQLAHEAPTPTTEQEDQDGSE